MSKPTDYTIIQLANFGAPYSGNFIASLSALGTVLKREGFQQVLIFPERAKDKAWLAELQKNNVPVYLLPEKVSPFYLAKEIAGIAMMENAVILHTHFTNFDVPAWLAGILMKAKKRCPAIVWHVHSAFPIKQTILRRIKDILKLQLMGRSVKMITVSEELRRSLIGRGFSGCVQVVLNGIDILKARQANSSKFELRKELDIPEDKLLFLAFGWTPLIKGVDLLLEAFEKLNGEKECVLLIIGGSNLKEFVEERLGRKWPSCNFSSAEREC